jgi:CxxC motif-containing protein
MIKFPSIEQFRNIVKEVKIHHDYQGKNEDGSPIYNHLTPYPTIEFTGTVKLHGTNAGIVMYKDRIEFQSRERVLSLQQDNSQFMLQMSGKNLDNLFGRMATEFNDYIAVFGEWCGQGIQKGVAVSELPKMFVVFAVQVDGVWVTPNYFYDNEQGIYNIHQFPNYSIRVDFNNPELVQNKLVELTEIVENECPVGKHFGVSGIGEGIVWKSQYNDQFYQFKVKGEKHSVSKVKTLASVDVENVQNVKEFVDNVLTEARLNQGISWLKENNKPVDQTSTGDYLRWVITDVIKEEQDTIVTNQLDPKKIGGILNSKARVWYFNQLN